MHSGRPRMTPGSCPALAAIIQRMADAQFRRSSVESGSEQAEDDGETPLQRFHQLCPFSKQAAAVAARQKETGEPLEFQVLSSEEKHKDLEIDKESSTSLKDNSPDRANPGENESVPVSQSESDTETHETDNSYILSPNIKRKSPRPKPKSPISDPNFMCEHCGKSWTSNYKLRNHLRVHTKEKPFKCSECDAKFTQKYDCERHERAHFGDVRTYDCTVCGRSLASSSSLAKHMTIHTGIKKFKCQRCFKAFPTNGDLTKHIRVHTGEKPYNCDVCGRAFAESSSRNRHRMTHTGDKPHKCQYCYEAFLRTNDLKRHIERRHNKQGADHSYQSQETVTPGGVDVPVYDLADIRSGSISPGGEILLEEVMREDGEMVYVVVNSDQQQNKNQEMKGVKARNNDIITVTLDRNLDKTSVLSAPTTSSITSLAQTSTSSTFLTTPTLTMTGTCPIMAGKSPAEVGVAELMNSIERVEEMSNLDTSDTSASNLPPGIEILHTGQEDKTVPTRESDIGDKLGQPAEVEVPHKKVIDYIVPQPRRLALADNSGDKLSDSTDNPYIFSIGTSEVEAQIMNGPKTTDISASKENAQGDFLCTTCDQTFMESQDLHDHFQEEHLNEDDDDEDNDDNDKDDNGEESSSPRVKKKKRKRRAKPLLARETHDCPQCDKRYNTQSALVSHMRHHTGPKKDRKFECNTCTWKFPTLYKLTAHMRSHSDLRPFKCPYCEKAYKARGDLRRHVAAHIDPEQAKQYLCSICGAALASTSSLKKHLNIHSGTRNFPCNLCTKSFYSKGDLDKHFRIHTGDKPYKCNVCQRAFAESSTRNSHQRLHSGEKRFECTVCQKRFNRSGDLNRHTRQHTGERRYRCPNCDSSFIDSDALTAHRMRFQDQQSGQMQCKKAPLEFTRPESDPREGVDVTSLCHQNYQADKVDELNRLQRDKTDSNPSHMYHRDKADTSIYAREMAPGVYVRSPDKSEMNIYVSGYSRDKLDMTSHHGSIYNKDKSTEMNPMYERDKVDIHSGVYPREVHTNAYSYSRPNPMEFSSNPGLYNRANPMDFSANFDPYQRSSMSGIGPVSGGQRVLEIREVDSTSGTYRYGFGGTISVVE